MKFPKAGRAWFIFFGIAGVVLAAMWVRSYWWVDTVELNGARARWSLGSGQGEVGLGVQSTSHFRGPAPAVQYERYKPNFKYSFPRPSFLGFVLIWNSVERGFLVPYWALVVGVTLAAIFPRLMWRFSLRALLIFATVIAVLLGVMRALV